MSAVNDMGDSCGGQESSKDNLCKFSVKKLV